jgi:hypothetical protein
MDVSQATRDVLLGASLRQIAAEYREDRIEALSCNRDEVTNDTCRDETVVFMRELTRHLGERHAGDVRIGHALREWVRFSDDYEAWDALLSGFVFEGRAGLLRRGKVLFPRTLTAHWEGA